MTDVLEHKGFIGSVHFSAEDAVFFGKLEGIGDLVSFEGKSVDELETAFHEAVDDYRALCAKVDKPPEKSYKGSFNIRIRSELHRLACRQAIREGKTLNQYIQDAVEHDLRERSPEYASAKPPVVKRVEAGDGGEHRR
jgi:predicted HicB family RNase H-like nuclease